MNTRFLIAAALLLVGTAMNPAGAQTSKPTVVLVHGAFAESSSWDTVLSGSARRVIRSWPRPIRYAE